VQLQQGVAAPIEEWITSCGKCNNEANEIKRRLNASPELWEEDLHETQNVRMTRAGHDRWGVKKIVLIISDDYIHRVFKMPWYEQWKDVLEPIFARTGHSPDRVIRCLFALLPPDVTIPVHHDTGFWVENCHRVHVPIITNELVDFNIGLTADSMKKILLEEGDIIEFNNRCKHMVYNGWHQDRVHLIYDYIDDDCKIERSIRWNTLPPGEELAQTR
jgi:hypothetical protein